MNTFTGSVLSFRAGRQAPCSASALPLRQRASPSTPQESCTRLPLLCLLHLLVRSLRHCRRQRCDFENHRLSGKIVRRKKPHGIGDAESYVHVLVLPGNHLEGFLLRSYSEYPVNRVRYSCSSLSISFNAAPMASPLYEASVVSGIMLSSAPEGENQVRNLRSPHLLSLLHKHVLLHCHLVVAGVCLTLL